MHDSGLGSMVQQAFLLGRSRLYSKIVNSREKCRCRPARSNSKKENLWMEESCYSPGWPVVPRLRWWSITSDPQTQAEELCMPWYNCIKKSCKPILRMDALVNALLYELCELNQDHPKATSLMGCNEALLLNSLFISAWGTAQLCCVGCSATSLMC